MLALALYVFLPTCKTRMWTHMYYMLTPHCGVQNSQLFPIIPVYVIHLDINVLKVSYVFTLEFQVILSTSFQDFQIWYQQVQTMLESHINHANHQQVVTNPNRATLIVYCFKCGWYENHINCERVGLETVGVFFYDLKH